MCKLVRFNRVDGCYNSCLQRRAGSTSGWGVSIVPGREILVRFAEFELDLQSGELRTNGTSVKLQPQPAKILALLVRRRGETVTRTEIVEEVWGSDTSPYGRFEMRSAMMPNVLSTLRPFLNEVIAL